VEFALEPLPPIRADHDLVRALLVSLLDNALRHTRGQEHRRILVAARPGSPPVFTVSDNGPGFEPDSAATLFEPFRRGSDGSHGVGLAVAARAAERHGGAVWGEGRPGEGAVFSFRLAPLARS
jgi:signal transduction histidine kinase